MVVEFTTTNPLVRDTSFVDPSILDLAAKGRLLKGVPVDMTDVENSTFNLVNDLVVSDAPSVSNGMVTAQVMPASYSIAPALQIGVTQPIGYKFNLPPHDWSLPLRPRTVDPDAVGHAYTETSHGLRRGRLWYWVGAEDSTTSADAGGAQDVVDTEWGFQFLWNPTTISTNVTRNMDITPSSADKLRVVAGVFPGQETVDLSLVIDRTNDFACLYATADGSWGNFSTYYNTLYPGASQDQNIESQLRALMTQGTMADLEYLFKAVNGSGNGSLQWTNLLGKQTANVGYLAPTLLGIQLGPTLNSLSYVGWISNLSLNHTAFTQNMIPLRTEVNISIQCFSGSGLTSGA